MTSLVSAEGVTKRFGSFTAVDNVSFEIESGKILGLIGPNGAGKTTLLKALLGLTDCEGQLSVMGLDPFKQRKKLMQNICFIADVAVLPRWIRVTQLLDYVEAIHPNFSRKRAEELLQQTKNHGQLQGQAVIERHGHAAASFDHHVYRCEVAGS